MFVPVYVPVVVFIVRHAAVCHFSANCSNALEETQTRKANIGTCYFRFYSDSICCHLGAAAGRFAASLYEVSIKV